MPMWVLTFDCSTPRCVLALGHVDREAGTSDLVVSDEEDDAPNQASARLLPRIEKLLERAGKRPQELDLVACGRGPGTFTGSRVAVATAKGLAIGLDRQVVPLSTLAAVAASAGRDGPVLAVLDARRGEVYAAAYRCDGMGASRAIPSIESLTEERCAPLEEVLVEGAHVIGPGVAAHGGTSLGARQTTAIAGPTGAGLWAATTHAVATGQALDPARADVVYLRKSYAELGINRPKRRFVRSPFA
jgi:tRNA threonylcarbamoyl adenosine modification protein YeaZ